jgi:hypothetical protein
MVQIRCSKPERGQANVLTMFLPGFLKPWRYRTSTIGAGDLRDINGPIGDVSSVESPDS